MIQTTTAVSPVQLPVMLIAEVQDSLLVAMHDLHRLEGLLSHATENLLTRFADANIGLAGGANGLASHYAEVRSALNGAVTELQFQDMASQLIGHTANVLQGCANRLATLAMDCDDDELPLERDAMPDRPNPVTQSEMHAGEVELF